MRSLTVIAFTAKVFGFIKVPVYLVITLDLFIGLLIFVGVVSQVVGK